MLSHAGEIDAICRTFALAARSLGLFALSLRLDKGRPLGGLEISIRKLSSRLSCSSIAHRAGPYSMSCSLICAETLLGWKLGLALAEWELIYMQPHYVLQERRREASHKLRAQKSV